MGKILGWAAGLFVLLFLLTWCALNEQSRQLCAEYDFKPEGCEEYR